MLELLRPLRWLPAAWAVGCCLCACGSGSSSSATAELPSQPHSTDPTLPDTLSSVPEKPELYDADTSDLLPRYAGKLVAGSRYGRQFATQRLAEMRDRAVPEVVRVLKKVGRDPFSFGAAVNACETLQLLGVSHPEAVAALCETLRHESGTARTSAAKALGALRAPEAFEPLQAAFLQTDAIERVSHLRAIGSLRTSEVDPFLVQILEGSQWSLAVRSAAAEALAARPRETAEKQWRALAESPPPVGHIMKIALAATGDAESVQFARMMSNQYGNPMCLPATVTLAKSGDLEPALAALREKDSEVRLKLGLFALREVITAKPPIPYSRPTVAAALVARNEDPDLTVRIEALRCLRILGEPLPVDADLADLMHADPARVSRALEVVTDHQVAEPRAVPILLKRLHEAPLQGKRGFVQALGRLRSGDAARELARYLAGPHDVVDGIAFSDYVALQLANLGEAGAQALCEALELEKSPTRRLGLVQALSGSSSSKALDALERVAQTMEGEHREVRAAAIRGIPALAGDRGAKLLKRMLSVETDLAIRRLLNATLHDLY
ncbi:MAG: HEAT repeat domain-containing protein [Planctomycetes bacterium]|nr:HEAT repeat domain-containing protein [Planctomycetota bacterium]